MRVGLRLLSTDTESYIYEVPKLYENGGFDYIELRVIPNTLERIKYWKILKQNHNVDFVLHAPFSSLGVNLSEKSKFEFNKEMFEQAKEFLYELDADYMVVHSGVEGDIKETVRQLNIINPPKMLIENKPFTPPGDSEIKCRGAIPEEIEYVRKNHPCGFCLDIAHALCTANSLNKEPYEFLSEFQKFLPDAYHISDNPINSAYDGHRNLGKGEYDFKKILEIVDSSKNFTLETPKNSEYSLDMFAEEVKFLKSFVNQN